MRTDPRQSQVSTPSHPPHRLPWTSMAVPPLVVKLFVLAVVVLDCEAWLIRTSSSSQTTTTVRRRSHRREDDSDSRSTRTTYGTTTPPRRASLSLPDFASSSSLSSSSNNSNNIIKSDTKDIKVKVGLASDEWLKDYFMADADDVNWPPSFSIIRRSLGQLASGSDIRGRFVDHPRRGRNMGSAIAHCIGKSNLPALTPFAAHCFGFAFATMIQEQERRQQQFLDSSSSTDSEKLIICVGRDPREHGTILADAFARGASGVPNVKVVYTGIATTPAMFEFCRSSLCHGGVMVTASHLPVDRNGFKFFSRTVGGFTKPHIQRMIEVARDHSQLWFDMGVIPPTSGVGGVFASAFVHWMPHYEQQLKTSLQRQVEGDNDATREEKDDGKPLQGLTIVLNAGNGSGGFFRQVLEDMGANVDGSIHTTVDGSFPKGVPNPEYSRMITETIDACEKAHADLGILLDTDADRCGMVAPRTYKPLEGGSGLNYQPTDYEPLNRNRLIAMMGVIFARQSPGCAIVTDSVTSNGLSKFLEQDLELTHIRYLRGYANVIQKAQSLIEQDHVNAQVAIETSGHCAVRENGFLDDGTFTAIKVLGLLAQERRKEKDTLSEDAPKSQRKSLLNLIAGLEELDEVAEFRLPALDGTLESVRALFDFVALEIEFACDENAAWLIDMENLEGVRVSIVGGRSEREEDGGFFLIRKSLHDPVICLQVEARSKEAANSVVVKPLLKILRSEPRIAAGLDLSDLEDYDG